MLRPPEPEVVELALNRAEEVVRAAGGCIDSLSFGREWKAIFPESSREMFQGTNVTSFNKLLMTYGSDRFFVEDTKKKEVKLFVLKDVEGEEGRKAYELAEQQLKDLANSPLGAFFDIRGGRMKAGGSKALAPNLASITKLEELLDTLEPNLVAFAGGMNNVAGKDAATALNHIKRLNYQARYEVQKNRVESFVRVFADIATKQLTNLNPKSIALLLNALSDREGYEAVFEAASRRVQELAKQEADTTGEAGFSPQAVAIIVNASVRRKRRDEALFRALSSVVLRLPPQDFDAQAVANIANAFANADVRPRDHALFAHLSDITRAMSRDSWNAAALAITAQALVKSEEATGELLDLLADNAVALYEREGAGAWWSPTALSGLLEALRRAGHKQAGALAMAQEVTVQHLSLYHRLKAPSRLQSANSKRKGGMKVGRVGKLSAEESAASKFGKALKPDTLSSLALSLRWGGADGAGLWEELGKALLGVDFQAQHASNLPAAVQAFGATESKAARAHLAKSLLALPAATLSSPRIASGLLLALGRSSWKDGGLVTRLITTLAGLNVFSFSATTLLDTLAALQLLQMPRHCAPLLPRLAAAATHILSQDMDAARPRPGMTPLQLFAALSALHSLNTPAEALDVTVIAAHKTLPLLKIEPSDCPELMEIADLFDKLGKSSQAKEWRAAAAENSLLTKISELG